MPWRSSSASARVIFHVAVLMAAFNAAITVSDVRTYGGTDLRARVVGARALVLGLNPYRPIPPGHRQEWLFDPHGPYRDVSRCPYAPPLVALYALICWLPYSTQRGAWFLIEWAALLVAIAWLARTIRPASVRVFFLVPALVFVAGGAFWRLHVERGQYYVLLLVLWTWAVAEAARVRNGDSWRMGLPLGIAAALRPSLLVVAAPLWLLGFRRAAVATVGSAAGIVIALLPVTGVSLWRDYARLVAIYEKAVPALPAFAEMPVAVHVENADFTRVLPHRSSNANVHLFLVTLGAHVGWPPAKHIPVLAKVMCAMTLGMFCALLVVRGRERAWSARGAIVAAQALAMTTDHFLPVRWGYADVLYLAPLSVLTPTMMRGRGQRLLFVVASALVLGHSMFEPLDAGPGSLVRPALLTAALVAWAVGRRRSGA